MPVDFLTAKQKENYCNFPVNPPPEILYKYFHLSDHDKVLINECRRSYNKVGYALQLTTVRFMGAFIANPLNVPEIIKSYIIKQLGIKDIANLGNYLVRKSTKYEHVIQIKEKFGYSEFNKLWYFKLSRWLYNQCWYGVERPSILFDRTVSWLTDRKVLLPGITTLTRLISRIRDRCNSRLWYILSQLPSEKQIETLESLLKPVKDRRYSELDQLKSAPTRISSNALISAVKRYEKIKAIGIRKLDFARIPYIKIRNFARFVATSWSPSISKMPKDKRIAMLVSFIYIYEIQALDDVLDLLDMLTSAIILSAKRNGEQNRLRTLGDLDKSASELARFAQLFLDNEPKKNLVKLIYTAFTKEQITNAITTVNSLARREHNKYHEEMIEQYKKVRRFLPLVLQSINFNSTKSGQNTYEALKFLSYIEGKKKVNMNDAPKEIITESWRPLVISKSTNTINRAGYTLCALDSLQSKIRSKDLFVEDSEKWCDPRAKLLSGDIWQAQKNPVCKSLGLPIEYSEGIDLLSNDLNISYKTALENLSINKDLKIIHDKNGKKKIQLSKLEKIEDPESLVSLRAKILSLLPRIDLPELLMEVNRLTGFTLEFTHISESESRMKDLDISICAVLMAEACNIGLEPLIANEPALSRDRLSWVQQNYFSSENIAKSNARLVDYHTDLPLSQKIGNGDVILGMELDLLVQ